jgi:hypothetical protein
LVKAEQETNIWPQAPCPIQKPKVVSKNDEACIEGILFCRNKWDKKMANDDYPTIIVQEG